MTLNSISPSDAFLLAERGARFVDVREPDEFARRHVEGAINLPLSRLEPLPPVPHPTVFMCRSGNRTSANCDTLAAASGGNAFLLRGGIDAWAKARLPVVEDRGRPIEIMRQVQIAAGLMVLAGVVLGLVANLYWLTLSAIVGTGLAFAGLTGWCGMARFVALMPWNRSQPA